MKTRVATGNNAMRRRKFGAMVGPMKTKQMIGVILILAGVVCFWAESADKSQSDWKIDVLGIALVLFGIWVGQFKFRKNQDGGTH